MLNRLKALASSTVNEKSHQCKNKMILLTFPEISPVKGESYGISVLQDMLSGAQLPSVICHCGKEGGENATHYDES